MRWEITRKFAPFIRLEYERALGETARIANAPQFCDACFTGDYPTRLTDHEAAETPTQLGLLAERRG